MISREQNPDFLNSFLDYSITILNKSPNSIKEYNYDLATFLKYMKIHFHLTNKTDFKEININDFPVHILNNIKLEDKVVTFEYCSDNENKEEKKKFYKLFTQ